MSFDAAIGLLQQESGKALDPRVVQTFIEHVSGAGRRSRRQPGAGAQADARAPRTRPRRSRPSACCPSRPARTNVFEDIALAHREIYALYEIAQAMGTSLGVSDTMALISSKLSNIVPFSCCALFLLQRGDRDAALPVRDRRRAPS